MRFLKQVVLTPLSWLYMTAVMIRHISYKIGLLRSYTLPVPVICVGNLTTGGTGKTPAVITIARLLLNNGHNPALITRGFGRAGNNLEIISAENKSIDNVSVSGDEAVLITRKLPKLTVIADAVRYRGGLKAVEQYKSDCIILDDGFQHFALKRDLNILLIDCLDPWGGKKWLPAGRLREPLKALARADMIVLTRTDLVSTDKKKKIYETIHSVLSALSNPVIIESIHKPTQLTDLNGKNSRNIAWLPGKKVIALAGIGNAKAFVKTIEYNGAEIRKLFEFPDHHAYTKGELQSIIDFSRKQHCPIITTGKDAVRITSLQMPADNIYVLDIEFTITKGEEFLKTGLQELMQ